MFLNYFSLGVLCMGLTMAFYAFIYIHDIPYNIAKKRNHPQAEAIHAACWLSLFTLHAIWPIVFIWAISKQRPMEVSVKQNDGFEQSIRADLAKLEERLTRIETKPTSR